MDDQVLREAVYQYTMVTQGFIQALGMMSENLQRIQNGDAIAYPEKAFNDLIEIQGIYHNKAVDIFRR